MAEAFISGPDGDIGKDSLSSLVHLLTHRDNPANPLNQSEASFLSFRSFPSDFLKVRIRLFRSLPTAISSRSSQRPVAVTCHK